MDNSVEEELEDLRLSDEEDDDNVKIILNNKAADGRNDSFSETPAPSECNLNRAKHQDEHQKHSLQTNADFLNQSFETQRLLSEPMKESETDFPELEQCGKISEAGNENVVCELPKESVFEQVKESETFKNIRVAEDHVMMSAMVQTFTESYFESALPEVQVPQNVPDSEETVEKITATKTEINTKQQSAPKSGKQLRPDAPVFMPTFFNAVPQWSSNEFNTKPAFEPSSVLDLSTEANEEVAETATFLVGVENEPPVLETCNSPEAEQLDFEPATFNSTPRGKISTGASSSEDKVPSTVVDQQISQPVLSKDSLPSSLNEKFLNKSAAKSTSTCNTNGFDLKIKQLVASNYMYQCQMKALKQDQKRLLLLLSNSKVSKSKKHTFDMFVEEINKSQFEVRTLKLEKEQLERKLRTSAKQSSNLDSACQVTQVLTASRRQSVGCQTLPNLQTEEKLLTFQSAQYEQQITELKHFLGKLYMHNALPSGEQLQVAEAVTELDSKLTQHSDQLKEHIAKLSDLQSVTELCIFNSPHPNLGAEILSLKNEIFDKMLYSLPGAKQEQNSSQTKGLPGLKSVSTDDLSQPKEVSIVKNNLCASDKSERDSQVCSASGSGSESESEEEESNRVAFRVPIKKLQILNPSKIQSPRRPDPVKRDPNENVDTKHESTCKKPVISLSSSGTGECDVSMSSNSCNNKDTKSNSSVTSGSFSNSAVRNETSEITGKHPDQQNSSSKSVSVSSDSHSTPENENAPEYSRRNSTNSNPNLENSARRKVDSIIEELEKLYPDKNRSELSELIKFSGQYLSKQGYNMSQITIADVVEGAKHVGKQLGYSAAL